MAKELATTSSTEVALSTEMEAFLAANAGAGTSADPEHNTIPMIYVLQTNSPQVNKRNDKYVNGAEPGDLWLKSGATPIIKGTEGVMFQPCYFQYVWVEWKPNREGFVTSHKKRPIDAEQKQMDPNDDRLFWVRPNGNQVIETCYVYGFVDMKYPYVIPLSSSGYRVAREWNADVRNKVYNDKTLPAWATRYRLKTVLRNNSKGEWFTLGFEYVPGFPTDSQLRNGKDFESGIETGEKRTEQPHSEDNIPF